MTKSASILLLLCFLGGFIYLGSDEDDKPTGEPYVEETASALDDVGESLVAIVTLTTGMALYFLCPLFRLVVNVILAVFLGGALIDRIGGEG